MSNPTPLARDPKAFGAVCVAARGHLSEAVDLLLIHNERDVRGRQPRASLNPPTVLIAVASWERFVCDIGALVEDNEWHGSGTALSRSAGMTRARKILAVASGDRLPEAWNVCVFDSWVGKSPRRAESVGDGDDLERRVNEWIGLRNAIAHRAFAQHSSPESIWNSDADGDTIQSGAARSALSLFLQLIDQSIQAMTEAIEECVDLENLRRWRLPQAWFDAEHPTGLRGTSKPSILWDGHALNRAG